LFGSLNINSHLLIIPDPMHVDEIGGEVSARELLDRACHEYISHLLTARRSQVTTQVSSYLTQLCGLIVNHCICRCLLKQHCHHQYQGVRQQPVAEHDRPHQQALPQAGLRNPVLLLSSR
jgi:hypothetical protein